MAQTTAGARTRSEILSQPSCWRECLRALDESGELRRLEGWSPAAEWLFIGCGSSYYVALAAAASWTALTGQAARALPASELLLFPALSVPSSRSAQPVLISRSGHTSEVLKVAEWLELKQNLRTLAISCATHQPLEEICALTLHLLPADEQSLVMTRSFTSLLLGLQALAACQPTGPPAWGEALRRLPEEMQAVVETLARRLEEFAQAQEFADYVFLGQGPFFALASEGMLKVLEMSCSSAQCFHTLEFRHGPKALVSHETLVIFLLSESGYEAEREVLEEVKELGGRTLVVANRADARTRRAADLLLELNLTVPEYARLAAYALPGQLLGLATGLKKGYDPDRPRHLSRAVILGNRNG
jgi:glucosamine--fructose-6-phosphate aminotransferase (isomerizing)